MCGIIFTVVVSDANVAQLVEQQFRKLQVASSILVIGSRAIGV